MDVRHSLDLRIEQQRAAELSSIIRQDWSIEKRFRSVSIISNFLTFLNTVPGLFIVPSVMWALSRTSLTRLLFQYICPILPKSSFSKKKRKKKHLNPSTFLLFPSSCLFVVVLRLDSNILSAGTDQSVMRTLYSDVSLRPLLAKMNATCFPWRANLYTWIHEYINIHIFKAFLYVSKLLFNVCVCVCIMDDLSVCCVCVCYISLQYERHNVVYLGFSSTFFLYPCNT